MPGPPPKDPGTRQRGNKTSTRATLRAVEDPEIPPLPDARNWLADGPEVHGEAVEWSQPVKEWWRTIWSSPMSSEFDESDIPQLYLAAFYLHQVTNRWLKMTERLAAAKQHETAVRNFGLNPMSRRSLQWEIEKAEDAQARGTQRKERTAEKERARAKPHAPDPRDADPEDDDNPWAGARKKVESA